jgi:signal transduction histidine kinase
MGIHGSRTHTLDDADDGVSGANAMSDYWDDWDDSNDESGDRRMHRHDRHDRHHRRKRRRSRGKLTEEQKLYRHARRRAAAKLSFVTHFVTYAAVIVMLLFVAGPRAAIATGFGWGIFVFLHYFAALVAPDLRRRFVADEVSRTVQQSAGLERKSLESEHARSLEQLSARVAHEIRNPITAAKSLVQQMGEDPASRENVEYASVALEELDRVERSISHLLRFARDEEIRFEEISLAEVTDSALETFRDRLERAAIDVRRDVDPGSWMQGDPEKIRRVLINLIGNAIDALTESGTKGPRIEIASGENLAGTELWLRVRDNGPGIPAEAQREIFSPFYTSKPTGNGLGLAISKKVIDAHGGSIELQSEPGAGSEFLIVLPKRAPAGGASA